MLSPGARKLKDLATMAENWAEEIERRVKNDPAGVFHEEVIEYMVPYVFHLFADAHITEAELEEFGDHISEIYSHLKKKGVASDDQRKLNGR